MAAARHQENMPPNPIDMGHRFPDQENILFPPGGIRDLGESTQFPQDEQRYQDLSDSAEYSHLLQSSQEYSYTVTNGPLGTGETDENVSIPVFIENYVLTLVKAGDIGSRSYHIVEFPGNPPSFTIDIEVRRKSNGKSEYGILKFVPKEKFKPKTFPDERKLEKKVSAEPMGQRIILGLETHTLRLHVTSFRQDGVALTPPEVAVVIESTQDLRSDVHSMVAALDLPQGLDIGFTQVGNEIRVEYPVGSGFVLFTATSEQIPPSFFPKEAEAFMNSVEQAEAETFQDQDEEQQTQEQIEAQESVREIRVEGSESMMVGGGVELFLNCMYMPSENVVAELGRDNLERTWNMYITREEGVPESIHYVSHGNGKTTLTIDGIEYTDAHMRDRYADRPWVYAIASYMQWLPAIESYISEEYLVAGQEYWQAVGKEEGEKERLKLHRKELRVLNEAPLVNQSHSTRETVPLFDALPTELGTAGRGTLDFPSSEKAGDLEKHAILKNAKRVALVIPGVAGFILCSPSEVHGLIARHWAGIGFGQMDPAVEVQASYRPDSYQNGQMLTFFCQPIEDGRIRGILDRTAVYCIPMDDANAEGVLAQYQENIQAQKEKKKLTVKTLEPWVQDVIETRFLLMRDLQFGGQEDLPLEAQIAGLCRAYKQTLAWINGIQSGYKTRAYDGAVILAGLGDTSVFGDLNQPSILENFAKVAKAQAKTLCELHIRHELAVQADLILANTLSEQERRTVDEVLAHFREVDVEGTPEAFLTRQAKRLVSFGLSRLPLVRRDAVELSPGTYSVKEIGTVADAVYVAVAKQMGLPENIDRDDASFFHEQMTDVRKVERKHRDSYISTTARDFVAPFHRMMVREADDIPLLPDPATYLEVENRYTGHLRYTDEERVLVRKLQSARDLNGFIATLQALRPNDYAALAGALRKMDIGKRADFVFIEAILNGDLTRCADIVSGAALNPDRPQKTTVKPEHIKRAIDNPHHIAVLADAVRAIASNTRWTTKFPTKASSAEDIALYELVNDLFNSARMPHKDAIVRLRMQIAPAIMGVVVRDVEANKVTAVERLDFLYRTAIESVIDQMENAKVDPKIIQALLHKMESAPEHIQIQLLSSIGKILEHRLDNPENIGDLQTYYDEASAFIQAQGISTKDINVSWNNASANTVHTRARTSEVSAKIDRDADVIAKLLNVA